MSAKLLALWGRPKDAEEFDRHYRQVHLELVKRWPGLQSYYVVRITGTPSGGEAPYHQVFEATFATEEDLRQALRSPAMADAGRDAAEMVRRFGATLTLLVGTVESAV
ncbi:MAG: EthD family reductase [candidate division GAL15 bacterium]